MAFLLTFIIFSIPIYVILSTPAWKNPYYLPPLIIPLCLLLTSTTYSIFLTRLLSFTSCVLLYISYTRTRLPFVLIEVVFVKTEFFTSFFEAHDYQRILTYVFTLIFPLIGGVLAYYLIRLN